MKVTALLVAVAICTVDAGSSTQHPPRQPYDINGTHSPVSRPRHTYPRNGTLHNGHRTKFPAISASEHHRNHSKPPSGNAVVDHPVDLPRRNGSHRHYSGNRFDANAGKPHHAKHPSTTSP
ncbi:hypothetical protein H257_11964 [Aphanomyces astaci]|uniref:RxLR effector protein n=1 Tax=Aphanomyces astaci TaxID=112090 RepID=W4G1J6_APHAT|nr:hypothetical protein H257_11964 [Aphanomyces astaci]ETV73146.1 hypothetical protein H257_11964 [Aphanomyces astaci]|eukprot:XP_009837351.1 hypothetical protein H257_11964 [Aphanomyces astaci]